MMKKYVENYEKINCRLGEVVAWIACISMFLGIFKVISGTLTAIAIFAPMILYSIYVFVSEYILVERMGYELNYEDELV